MEDFSHDHMIPNSCILLEDTINMLNELRAWYLKWDYMSEKDREHFDQNIHDKKDLWWQMIQLLPSSYNQTRNVMMNYEVLANIYKSRRGHKLDEWKTMCEWIETLPYSELITGKKSISDEERFKNKIDRAIENYGKTDEMNDIVDKLCAIGNPNPLTAEEIRKLVGQKED